MSIEDVSVDDIAKMLIDVARRAYAKGMQKALRDYAWSNLNNVLCIGSVGAGNFTHLEDALMELDTKLLDKDWKPWLEEEEQGESTNYRGDEYSNYDDLNDGSEDG